MPSIVCIVLNYKTPDLAVQATEAARAQLAAYPGSYVHIVDNDSRDGSYEKLRKAVREHGWSDVRVTHAGRNGGYGAGNNIGIRAALRDPSPPDYLYILNPDARPDEGSIAALVDFMERTPDAAAAGSALHGPDGEPHNTAFRFPTFESEVIAGFRLGVVARLFKEREVAIRPIPSETREVDWTAGASLMIRRSVLEEVGLFDETFFLYFEETDLCRRMRLAGYRIYYVVESQTTHIGSVSTGMKDNEKPMPRFWFESRRHYFVKNHGKGYAWAANVAHITGLSTFNVINRLRGRDGVDRKNYYSDFIRFNFGDGRP
ncbi:MAG: glycosyltransferase family 2 protein [Myxococcota bacterium]